jgi:divalent metal cation (Fe/Co/Zn/Cd) transporter
MVELEQCDVTCVEPEKVAAVLARLPDEGAAHELAETFRILSDPGRGAAGTSSPPSTTPTCGSCSTSGSSTSGIAMADDLAVLARRARLLAWGTNAWHVVEFAVALASGIAASSTALIGFGVDSLIEALAGFVVIWRFTGRRGGSALAEGQAQRLVAVSFFLLAAYVGADTLRTLASGHHPQTSWPGIVLAAFAAVTMPLVASAKHRLGHRLHSLAAVREGHQNQLCGYLSLALLVGLGANAAFGWWWADSLVALFIVAVAVREGIQGWRGDACCDAC